MEVIAWRNKVVTIGHDMVIPGSCHGHVFVDQLFTPLNVHANFKTK